MKKRVQKDIKNKKYKERNTNLIQTSYKEQLSTVNTHSQII